VFKRKIAIYPPLAPCFYKENKEGVTIIASYFEYQGSRARVIQAPVKALVDYIKGLPASVKRISIKGLVLEDYPYDIFVRPESEIIEILSATPPHVTHLDLHSTVGLRSNFEKFIDAGKILIEIGALNLVTWPSKRTHIFETIPRTITFLSLSEDTLCNGYSGYHDLIWYTLGGDVGASIRALPHKLERLSFNNITLLSEKNLSAVMTALPRSLRILDFSKLPGLQNFTPKTLSIVLKSLPLNIEELNLSNLFSIHTLSNVGANPFANLPKSLRKLDLTDNGLGLALAKLDLADDGRGLTPYNSNIDKLLSILESIPIEVDQIIIREQNFEDTTYIDSLIHILPELDKRIPNARQRLKFHPQIHEHWATLPMPDTVIASTPHRPEVVAQQTPSQSNSHYPTIQAKFLLKCLAGVAMYAGLLLLIGFLASPIAAGVVAGALVIGASFLTYRFFCRKDKKEQEPNSNALVPALG
jgi:hypothetical protein